MTEANGANLRGGEPRRNQAKMGIGSMHRDDDKAFGLIAQTIVEHLKLRRWQLGHRPPVAPHGTGTKEGDDSFEPTPGR